MRFAVPNRKARSDNHQHHPVDLVHFLPAKTVIRYTIQHISYRPERRIVGCTNRIGWTMAVPANR